MTQCSPCERPATYKLTTQPMVFHMLGLGSRSIGCQRLAARRPYHLLRQLAQWEEREVTEPAQRVIVAG